MGLRVVGGWGPDLNIKFHIYFFNPSLMLFPNLKISFIKLIQMVAVTQGFFKVKQMAAVTLAQESFLAARLKIFYTQFKLLHTICSTQKLPI